MHKDVATVDHTSTVDQHELIDRWLQTHPSAARRLARGSRVSPAAISHWRRGRRDLGIDDIAALESVLDTGGLLAKLLWASRTPAALPPRPVWEHNFEQTEIEPAFCWVRPATPGPHTIDVRWGVLGFSLRDLDLRADGVFLEGPMRINNPRLVVTVTPAGWVDFIDDAAPATLGMRVVQCSSRLLLSAAPNYYKHVIRTVMPRLLRRKPSDLDEFLGVGAPVATQLLADRSHGTWGQTVTAAPPTHQLPTDRVALTEARKGRGLAQAEVARQLSALLTVPISRDTLGRFERGHRPDEAWELLPAALDHLYGADGWLGQAALTKSRGGSIRFPFWWRGPIWLRAAAACNVKLTWPPYQQRLRFVQGGQVLWIRCADPGAPLEVAVEPDVELTVGLGRVRGAFDANEDWAPANESSLRRILDFGELVIEAISAKDRPSVRKMLLRPVSRRG